MQGRGPDALAGLVPASLARPAVQCPPFSRRLRAIRIVDCIGGLHWCNVSGGESELPSSASEEILVPSVRTDGAVDRRRTVGQRAVHCVASSDLDVLRSAIVVETFAAVQQLLPWDRYLSSAPHLGQYRGLMERPRYELQAGHRQFLNENASAPPASTRKAVTMTRRGRFPVDIGLLRLRSHSIPKNPTISGTVRMICRTRRFLNWILNSRFCSSV